MKDQPLGRVLRIGAWGILVGGLAGLALGLLVAPEEGRKTRRRLAYQLENLAGQASKLAKQVLHGEPGSEARREGDELVADAQAKAQQIRDDIDALLGEIRQHQSSTTTE